MLSSRATFATLPSAAATIATDSVLNSLVNFRRLRLTFADMDTPFWPHQAKVGVRQTGSTSHVGPFGMCELSVCFM